MIIRCRPISDCNLHLSSTKVSYKEHFYYYNCFLELKIYKIVYKIVDFIIH